MDFPILIAQESTCEGSHCSHTPPPMEVEDGNTSHALANRDLVRLNDLKGRMRCFFSWWRTPLKINGWNMSSWRCGSDHFPWQKWVICSSMLIFRGVGGVPQWIALLSLEHPRLRSEEWQGNPLHLWYLHPLRSVGHSYNPRPKRFISFAIVAVGEEVQFPQKTKLGKWYHKYTLWWTNMTRKYPHVQ